MEDGSSALAPLGGARREGLAFGQTPLPQQRRTADGGRLTVDARFDAPSRDRTEAFRCRRFDPPISRRGHDGEGNGVLAVSLHRRREGEHLTFGHAIADHPGDSVPAGGEGAGLVEQHGVDGAHAFEGETVLHQDPGARGDAGRHRDGERDGEAERVGAGDDEHGHGALHGLVDLTERAPDGEGDDAADRGHVEQQRREPVGEGLGT